MIADSQINEIMFHTWYKMAPGAFVRAMKSLSCRERQILKLRYGMGDGYTYTLEEVGRIFRVSRDRVRHLEAKGVRKFLCYFRWTVNRQECHA
jgi:RNA polymerase primary sigma factor